MEGKALAGKRFHACLVISAFVHTVRSFGVAHANCSQREETGLVFPRACWLY